MAKSYVTLKVTGKFVVEANTKNIEKAKEIANNAFAEADFGVLSDIDASPTKIEDENGNFIWED